MKPVTAFAVFITVIILWSCKNSEPEVKPPVTAIRVAPAYGQVGALLTITGTNFGSDKALVKVVFGNNKEGTVESITPTEIKVIAPAGSMTGALTITVGEQSVQTPAFTFYSIYTYGTYGEAGGNTYQAAYWRDGVLTTLSTQRSEINDLVVVGNDVHAVGYEYGSGSYYPVYFKNGNKVSVEGSTLNTTFRSIAVSGSDVYICGIQVKYGLRGIAKFWKNGQEFTLNPSEDASAFDIQVSGGDVYIAGSVYPNAVYWKNGVLTSLSSGTGATAISIVGPDVYVAGTQSFQGGSFALVWKNGAETRLTVPDFNHNELEYEFAESLHVSNGEVYVGGGLNISSNSGGSLYVPKYWKNGTAFSLREKSNATLYVRSISTFQNDVITTISGNVFNASSYVYRNSDAIMSSTGIEMRLTGHNVVTY